jgi:membrane protein implicated in regulation of membrane protease activity
MANGGETREPTANRAVLIYNLLRLGLFAVCFGVGWFAGLRPVIALLVLALLVSGVLSWFLLRRQREAMGRAVERTVERSRRRMAERTAAEDDYQPSA